MNGGCCCLARRAHSDSETRRCAQRIAALPHHAPLRPLCRVQLAGHTSTWSRWSGEMLSRCSGKHRILLRGQRSESPLLSPRVSPTRRHRVQLLHAFITGRIHMGGTHGGDRALALLGLPGRVPGGTALRAPLMVPATARSSVRSSPLRGGWLQQLGRVRLGHLEGEARTVALPRQGREQRWISRGLSPQLQPLHAPAANPLGSVRPRVSTSQLGARCVRPTARSFDRHSCSTMPPGKCF